MKKVVSIEETDRGNVIRVEEQYDDGSKAGRSEVIPGQQGSMNLRDRTRRRVQRMAAEWFPHASGE